MRITSRVGDTPDRNVRRRDEWLLPVDNAPHRQQRVFIGLDIGNTRLTVGAALHDGRLLSVEERPAPTGADATVPALLSMAQTALDAARADGREPAGLGLGFGGPVDYERQRTRQSFHSPGWDDIPLAEVFEARCGIPALLDNDANAGGLGEALFGAGRGRGTLLYVNVGTGIGGAVILDGAVHHGATTSAGEIGHTIVDPDGPPCNCGRRGCLEAMASGSAIERMARDAGVHQTGGREVMAAAEAGDARCLAIVTQAAASLGLALANAVSLLDPELVVLGGGLPEAGPVWWEPVRETFRQHAIAPASEQTEVVRAQLGYHAGVLGAAALAIKAADIADKGALT